METITVEKKQEFIWVHSPQSLTVDNYIAVESAVRPHLTGKEDHLVFDMAHTEHIYSSGIGLLVRLHKMVMQSKGSFSLVNVSERLRKLFEEVRLNRIFNIYATDVEFEISRDELWGKKMAERRTGFLFVAQIEDNVYRIVLSGNMDTIHDLSEIRSFQPDPSVKRFLIDLRSLDLMDTFGFQTFIDLIRNILDARGRCATFGANQLVLEFLNALSTDYMIQHCATETEGLAWINS